MGDHSNVALRLFREGNNNKNELPVNRPVMLKKQSASTTDDIVTQCLVKSHLFV